MTSETLGHPRVSLLEDSMAYRDWPEAKKQRHRVLGRVTKKRWRDKNIEFARRKSREHRAKKVAEDPEYDKKLYAKYRDRLAARRYGLTIEEHTLLWKQSQNQCAICSSTVELCIDHCHETGVVRGVICKLCNKGLGHFRDNEVFLDRAITYLQIPRT